MRRQFADILDECLQELNRGADLEAVLTRHRDCAPRLRPLLEAALLVQQGPHPQLSPQANALGRRRLLEAVARKARQKAAPSRLRAKRPFLRWPSLPGWQVSRLSFRVASAALVLAIALASLGTVNAAADSLPDSPLYAVKLATERVQLALALSPESKARLHLSFAGRRLWEVHTQAELGKPISPVALEGMRSETEQALAVIAKAPQPEAWRLLHSFIALTEKQQETLEELSAEVLPPVRETVAEAIEDVQEKRQEAAAIAKAAATPTPTPTEMPSLTPTKKVATPTSAATPTPTATPTSTPTPVPTAKPTDTRTPTETPPSTPTETPVPTPTPTATPGVGGLPTPPIDEPTAAAPTLEPTATPTLEPTATPGVGGLPTPSIEEPTATPGVGGSPSLP